MATINVNAADVVKIAISEIGYKEKATNYNLDNPTSNIGSGNWTKYGRDLASAGYYGGSKNGYAWCDQFVDWCFYQACGKDKVAAEYIECQSGIYGAGCVNSAGYYKSVGRWANKPSIGAQIFFYVGGSINHTGIVESFDNNNVYTIEGNTSDMVARRTYNIYDSSIAGYGIPRYGVVNKGSTNVSNTKVSNVEVEISMPELSKGCKCSEVKTLQIMLQAKKYNIGNDGVDGDFGSQTENAVKLFQATNKLVADGEVGKDTWTKLLRS